MISDIPRQTVASIRKLPGGLRSGIGWRLVVRVLLFSSVVTLVLTASQLYRDYSRDVNDITSRLDEIGNSYHDSLGHGLWSLNEDQLRLELQGILRLPHVQAVEAYETTSADEPITIKVGERGTTAVIAREFPVVRAINGAKQTIGRFYVEATLTEVYRSLLDKALFILVGQGAKTFLVTFFIVYIFYRLVTRHLADITKFVGNYRMGQPSRLLALDRTAPDRPDELDQVVSAFNVMSAGLQSSYDQLREANNQLEQDNAALSKAESALRESEQMFRDYAETASDWFWATGPDHRFTYISEGAKAYAQDIGARVGGLRWDFAADLESDAEKWRAHRATLDRHEPFRDFVYTLHGEDGRVFRSSVSGKPVFDRNGTFMGYRGTGTDVTARSLAEARVRELSLAAEQSPAGIAIVNPSDRMVYCNKVFLQIIGFDQRGDDQTYTHLAMTDVLPDAVWQRLTAVVENGGVGREEVLADRLSGESFWGLVSVAGLKSFGDTAGNRVVAMQDITREKAEQQERENLERRLRQTGKMEAVGRLAGGIAHDFNNLLGAMMGFSELIVDDLPADSPAHKHADRIVRLCQRGKDMVEQLLAFSGVRDTERRVLDAVAVVHRCRDLMGTSLPTNVKLTVKTSETPVPVLGNEGQLHQVLFNLCLNAKDAFDDKPGTITIDLSHMRPDRATCKRVDETGAGKLDQNRAYALITVTDTGTGMNAETKARLFEPFYTTKDVGHGSGLGLAVVHNIVMTYGGAICLDSEPGVGTTFEIYLPLAETAPEPEAEGQGGRDDVHGSERILVVDDDPDLAQVLTIGLRRYGYDVTCLTDPKEALNTVAQGPEQWDLVVSDQMMPGMTGLTLISRLKELRPALRAVLYTGFDEGVAAGGVASLQGVDALILKPVAPKELATRIRQLLGG